MEDAFEGQKLGRAYIHYRLLRNTLFITPLFAAVQGLPVACRTEPNSLSLSFKATRDLASSYRLGLLTHYSPKYVLCSSQTK